MSVRRHVVRVVAANAVLGGLLVVGASPAYADEDSVRVRSTNGFSAGGSPGSVTVEVRKRSEGCVRVRTALGLQLDGLRADQVRMEVEADGGRAPVGVTGTDGSVGSGFVSPRRPVLCEGKKVQVRYRISFQAGAPAGRVAVFAQVSTAQGESFGQDATTSRVGGRLASSPGPAPTVTRSPVTSPSPSPTEEATREPTEALVTPTGAGLVPVAAEQPSAAPTSGSLSPILYFGVALVVLGLGLIVLLIRRSRADRRERADQAIPSGRPDGIGQPGHQRPPAAGPGPVPQPPRARENVYRSGGGSPAGRPAGGAPAASGGVYGRPAGQPAPPPPASPAGHVYGAPAARPTGHVYGAPPARPTGNVYGAPSAPAVPPSGPDPRSAGGSAAVPAVPPSGPDPRLAGGSAAVPAVPPSGPDPRLAGGSAAVPAVPPSGPDPRLAGPTAAAPGRPPQATPPPVPQATPPPAPAPSPPVSAAGGGADPSSAGPTTPATGSPAGDAPSSPPTAPGPQTAPERTSTQAGGDSTAVMPQPPQ
ncbi:hypothetical protein [Micromonospora sp. SH-82]|uniref:hypothetical protein n=1 Tax=Micromonospora sp. SH-82 TaxID=3132938 RepID=UPI003EBCAB16